MTSIVDICNMALTEIGETTILSLDTSDRPSRLCTLHYDNARKKLLVGHPWSFATERAELAPTDLPDGVFDFSNAFLLPTGYLNLVETNLLLDDPFRIEKGKILCNASTLKIAYTTDIVDPNLFSASFIEALKYELAVRLTMPLAQSTSLWEAMKMLAKESLSTAKFDDSTKQSQQTFDADAWYRSRFGFRT